jgi:hypothetical protein
MQIFAYGYFIILNFNYLIINYLSDKYINTTSFYGLFQYKYIELTFKMRIVKSMSFS